MEQGGEFYQAYPGKELLEYQCININVLNISYVKPKLNQLPPQSLTEVRETASEVEARSFLSLQLNMVAYRSRPCF